MFNLRRYSGSDNHPLFKEARTIKLHDDVEEVSVDEESKRKLEAVNKALLDSKISNKNMYSLWARYFTYGDVVGSDIVCFHISFDMRCPATPKIALTPIFPFLSP